MSASGLLVKVEPNNPRVNILSVPTNILHLFHVLKVTQSPGWTDGHYRGPLHLRPAARHEGERGAGQVILASDWSISSHISTILSSYWLQLPRAAQAERDAQERRDQVLRAEDRGGGVRVRGPRRPPPRRHRELRPALADARAAAQAEGAGRSTVLCKKLQKYLVTKNIYWKIFRWRAVTWRSFCCVTVRLIPRIQVTTAAAVSRTGAGRPGNNTEL